MMTSYKGLSLEERIICRIIDDITDRSGIGDEWQQIDAETKEDIKKEWVIIIKEEMGTNRE